MDFLEKPQRKQRAFLKWIQRRKKASLLSGAKGKKARAALFLDAIPGLIVLIAFAAFLYLNYVTLPEKYAQRHTQADLQQYAPHTRGVTHINTPHQVKAIYMSSWVAGTKNIRERLIKLMDTTEINAVVIDIKDYTGKISFEVHDPELLKEAPVERRIKDLGALIGDLHKRGIYVIGRVAAFQDPHMVAQYPELAVKTRDGKIWKDRKGISWIDAGAPQMWKYLVAIAKESYAQGFDEINFDYIRYPSDGDMADMVLPITGTRPKHEVLGNFFAYIKSNIKGKQTYDGLGNPKSQKGKGPVTSADIFGMTTTSHDDLNIGQRLEDALKYFDYVAPMVYPSHFPAQFMGIASPAHDPYATIKVSMGAAVSRAKAASTSPEKLRPWLQDFSLGAVYTPTMVRDQIRATYDVGLTSWMLWDPNNRYSESALLPK